MFYLPTILTLAICGLYCCIKYCRYNNGNPQAIPLGYAGRPQNDQPPVEDPPPAEDQNQND
jgi:hypothetical protein